MDDLGSLSAQAGERSTVRNRPPPDDGKIWQAIGKGCKAPGHGVRLSSANFHCMQSDLPTEGDTPEPAPYLVGSSIVCGTDFSEAAAQAVEVAAALAKNLREPLVLAHAVNEQPRESLPGELRESLSLYARAQLHAERERLHHMHVELVEAFRTGAPATVLLEEIAAQKARLVVLTTTNRRSLSHWLRGHVIEKVTQNSPVPTLIVRHPTPLIRWTRGERRLRIFVCADFSPASDAALRWVNWAQQVGAYQVVVACLEPSPAMLTAMDHPPSALMDDFTLKIGCMQERYFRQRVRKLIPGKRIRVRFEPNWGHSDSHLIQMAAEEHADLIVIGTHVHRGWHLSGRDSVSRGVLHYAPLNVLCVPGQSEATDGTAFSNPELVKKPTKP